MAITLPAAAVERFNQRHPSKHIPKHLILELFDHGDNKYSLNALFLDKLMLGPCRTNGETWTFEQLPERVQSRLVMSPLRPRDYNPEYDDYSAVAINVHRSGDDGVLFECVFRFKEEIKSVLKDMGLL